MRLRMRKSRSKWIWYMTRDYRVRIFVALRLLLLSSQISPSVPRLSRVEERIVSCALLLRLGRMDLTDVGISRIVPIGPEPGGYR